MKKYIGFLIVLTLFVLGARDAKAAISPEVPCVSNASPSITILSPNGGEVYTVGQQIPVKWISCNIPASATIIPVFMYVDSNDNGEVVHNSGAQSLTHVLNTGSTLITPPSSLFGILGKHFKIKLVYNSGYVNNTNSVQVVDYSNDTFTIQNASGITPCPEVGPLTLPPHPFVTVLSPNGGENYMMGDKMEVRWSNCRVSLESSDIVISLHQDGEWVNVVYLTNGTLNDGSEIFTIPNINPGSYKIRVGTSSAVVGQDYSDNLFAINSLPISSILPPGCHSAVGYSATNGLPCFIDTNPATSITKNSAVLNGRLIANAPSDVYFKYKKAGNWNEMLYTHKTSQQTNGLFAHTLSNLLPSTSYEFMACTDYSGAKRCAKLLTFTTLSSSEIQEEEIVVDQKLIYPAGCNSSEGYSYITGVKCSGNCSISGASCGAVATSAMVRKTLKQGIKDEEVKILQSFLNIKADGSFGPQTASAVKLFQAQKGLTPDGVVGPKTWTFINK